MSSYSSGTRRREAEHAGAALRSRSMPSSAALALQRFCVAGVIAAFMVSIYAYKTWYIAAAAALGVSVLLVVLANLRYRGVLGAVVPVAIYYGWLATTALWATLPQLTVWFALADSIGVAIVILFYLLALNQPHRIPGIFMALAWIAVPVTIVVFRLNPEATRSGGHAISVLPFVPAFCWGRFARGRQKLLSGITLIVTFGLLIFARSRTPILVAAFTTVLAVMAFSENILMFLKRATVALIVVVLAFSGLVALEPTRPMALTTFSRFTHIDIQFAGVYVESEPEVDPVRVDLHRAARRYVREHFLLGMGYHNFPYYFAREWSPIGREYTLHSMYETWWVEGGLVCLLIVFVLFFRHLRSLLRAMRFSADPEIRIVARMVLVTSMGIFVLGLFHQTHVNPMVYALIGIGAALPRVARMTTKKAGRGPAFFR